MHGGCLRCNDARVKTFQNSQGIRPPLSTCMKNEIQQSQTKNSLVTRHIQSSATLITIHFFIHVKKSFLGHEAKKVGVLQCIEVFISVKHRNEVRCPKLVLLKTSEELHMKPLPDCISKGLGKFFGGSVKSDPQKSDSSTVYCIVTERGFLGFLSNLVKKK